ncbi:unnamed protein product, partial [Prorocentrum cordatum]
PTAEGLLAQAAQMIRDPVLTQASLQCEQASSQVQRCKDSFEKTKAREAEAIRALATKEFS